VFQKEVTNQPPHKIGIITKHIGHITELFKQMDNAFWKPLLEQCSHVFLPKKLGGMTGIIEEIRDNRTTHQDIQKVRSRDDTQDIVTLQDGENSQLVLDDKVLDLSQKRIRGDRGEFYVHIVHHPVPSQIEKNRLFQYLPCHVALKVLMSIHDQENIDIVFGHGGSGLFNALIRRDLNDGG